MNKNKKSGCMGIFLASPFIIVSLVTLSILPETSYSLPIAAVALVFFIFGLGVLLTSGIAKQ